MILREIFLETNENGVLLVNDRILSQMGIVNINGIIPDRKKKQAHASRLRDRGVEVAKTVIYRKS